MNDPRPILNKMKDLEFTVAEKMCRECLFTNNRVVSEERAQEIIDGCVSKGTYFVCHKGSLSGDEHLCCRGFFDNHNVPITGLAKSLGLVKFVPLPDTIPLIPHKDQR